MTKIQAFSLLELLITMAMAAILASIAYPTYQYHLRRIHRRQAEMDLMNTAEHLEEYHSLNGNYRSATFSTLHISDHSAYYRYRLKQPTEQNYTLTATPTGVQTKDSCGTLWLHADGRRGGSRKNCWENY